MSAFIEPFGFYGEHNTTRHVNLSSMLHEKKQDCEIAKIERKWGDKKRKTT